MGYVDFILNLAGLLLWLNWRSLRFDPLVKRPPATLMGTLRPAAPDRLSRWHFLVAIAILLLLRAVFYWLIGSALKWSGKLDFQVVVFWFSCGSKWAGLLNMVAFSFLSFGLTLWVCYVVLLFLSLLSGSEPVNRLVTIPLGRVYAWPTWVKLSLPFVLSAVAWWVLSWVLGWLQIIPPPISAMHRIEQSVVIGLESYLIWKLPMAAILILHLLNSYIYFGKHPFWKYISEAAQKLLQPLRRIPLRLGRVDFAPILGIVLVFLCTSFIENGFQTAVRHGPRHEQLRPLIQIPGLVEIYKRLPL